MSDTASHPSQTGPDEGSYEPFLAALNKAIRPEVLDEAAAELAEVVAAVKAQGKKGALTLKVELTPMKNVPDAVEVTTRIKSTAPEPPARATPMWPDEDGRLHRNDPRQQRLQFGAPRPVDDTREDAR